jgi:hypothetical protein
VGRFGYLTFPILLSSCRHDGHDSRVVSLASTSWLASADLSPGPLLEAPLDPKVYAAYHDTANQHRHAAAAASKRAVTEMVAPDDFAESEDVAAATVPGVLPSPVPLVVLDDDTALDVAVLGGWNSRGIGRWTTCARDWYLRRSAGVSR